MTSRDPGPDPGFAARLEAHLPDLRATLGRVYGDAAPGVTDRLVTIMRAAHAERPADLRALDDQRLSEPDWFQRPSMVGYAAYADRFAGTLRGVGERTAYLRDLGVGYLHLMPLLTPRPAPNDGGYAVMDYRSLRPDLGDVDDLRALTTTLRAEGISLCLDLVLNHVAREHAWAAAARAGDQDKRAYFHVHEDRAVPDAYEATLPEVFPDFAPGSFTFDDELDAWVWTTFNDYQWDLDWSNPAVLCEFADIILALANVGVEVFRLDAIAFLWKRLGTDCQNQPEVHELTRALRTVARVAAPAVAFKAEAIVGPADLPAYLGVGEHAGRVSDLAYHNGLMVQVWSMLASGEVGLATHALQQLPQPPSTTAWITYVRCHDDIGWAIADADARAVGIDPAAHRRFLSDWYSGSFPGSWARGLVFQHNEATGDRRISGSTASSPASRSATRVRRRGSCWRTPWCAPSAASQWCGWATSSACSTTPAGPTTRRTPTTTAGCTGPGCRGTSSRRGRTRTASPPACGTCSTYVLGCRSCTRPRPPRSGTPATRGCCWSCAATPTARCWLRTTCRARRRGWPPTSCCGSASTRPTSATR